MNFDGLGPDKKPSYGELNVKPIAGSTEGRSRPGRKRQRSVSSPGMFRWEQEELRDIISIETKGIQREPTISRLSLVGELQREKSVCLTPPPSSQDDNSKAHVNQVTINPVNPSTNKTSKKLIRIKLPNNSYRTFPVLPDTTVTCIIEKIKAKMAKEKSDCETSSHIFQVNVDGSETILDDSVLVFDVLEAAPPTCEFIFKKQGEKIIDRNEELKLIALENRILEKKKENIQEALNTWMGDSKASSIPISTIVSISEKKHNPTFSCAPFSSSKSEKFNLFTQADIISSLLIEKNSATRRFVQLKKSKGNKSQQGSIDFTSKVSVVQRNGVFALSKISEVINYTVVVSGWRCFMKEFFCHINDFSSLKKALFEVALLETLPYHPNIIQYFYHTQTERSTQLFYATHGQSLRQFIEEYRVNHTTELPLGVIRTILMSLCNALSHLHTYSVVHNRLTSDDVFIRYDQHQEKVTQLVIGNFCYSVQMENPQCTVACTASSGESLTRYSAPELYQENNSYYSQASDIYSFGMICYELLCMEQPYAQHEGKENLLKIMKIRAEKPKCTFDDEKRCLFAAIYHACVEESPKQRPSILQLKQMIW
eukprot:CAMPEP_0206186730 /NCGR_PEP_ID=MMETSP0166-20121206/2572_1 /ASSEMBLY_ACC=CAM_ASM_000260 /TAXON_ID=95228 /ORGANISM="Vannella robusta, Strain DIVA3 518/3/11/1/6" /LENGTH=596 /DNA_ID=CAMNT_0053602161 /DNA_START=55 /DNA_END=1842 /DNA_ORIENTATION=-